MSAECKVEEQRQASNGKSLRRSNPRSRYLGDHWAKTQRTKQWKWQPRALQSPKPVPREPWRANTTMKEWLSSYQQRSRTDELMWNTSVAKNAPEAVSQPAVICNTCEWNTSEAKNASEAESNTRRGSLDAEKTCDWNTSEAKNAPEAGSDTRRQLKVDVGVKILSSKTLNVKQHTTRHTRASETRCLRNQTRDKMRWITIDNWWVQVFNKLTTINDVDCNLRRFCKLTSTNVCDQ